MSKLLKPENTRTVSQPGSKPHCQIPQSTIVSDLDSLDLRGVGEKVREAAEKDREMLREKLIILYV